MNDKLRIVLADNEEWAREYVRLCLTQLGHDVTAVENGTALIEVCRATPPDLIVCDPHVPDLDKIEAIEEILRGGPVSVILLSSVWEQPQLNRAAVMGASQCLSKPVKPLELVAAIEEVRSRRRASANVDPETAVDALFRQFVETIEEQALFTTDPQGRVMHWNQGARKVFGFSPATMVGRSWEAIFTPADVRDGVPARELQLAAQSGRAEQRRWHSRGDGSRLWAVGVVVPIRAKSGTLLGYGVALQDGTEAKEREDTIVNRALTLWERDEKRAAFLGTLAHELRNQLSPLAYSARVLRTRDAADSGLQTLSDRIERSVRRMASLIDEVYDADRVCRGKVQLARQRLDVRDVVTRAVDSARATCSELRHELTVSLPPAPLWTDADPDRLDQILVNLLSNAAKYTPEGGHIQIAARGEDNHVVLQVRDNGMGIPRDRIEAIFEMYTQLSRSPHRAQNGLGIGLAVVRELVTLHGGTVTAASDGEGEGSEFVVRLPTAADTPGNGTLDA